MYQAQKYIYVPAPWWKTDYFELRYENAANNRRYFYQLDGEGIRYELVAFVRAIDNGRMARYIEEYVSEAISSIVSDFHNGIDVIYIKIEEDIKMYYLDSRVENLYRIFDQNARKDYLRLDLNENPGGLPQEFIDDVLKNVTPQFVAQYPETLHFTEVLANHLGTDISHICLTNGSAEGIRYIIQRLPQ